MTSSHIFAAPDSYFGDMSAEASETTVLDSTIYLVRVTTRHGSYSVGWDDPARVLRAIAEFHENGFGDVGVYDLEGRKVEFAAIQAAVRAPGDGLER